MLSMAHREEGSSTASLDLLAGQVKELRPVSAFSPLRFLTTLTSFSQILVPPRPGGSPEVLMVYVCLMHLLFSCLSINRLQPNMRSRMTEL